MSYRIDSILDTWVGSSPRMEGFFRDELANRILILPAKLGKRIQSIPMACWERSPPPRTCLQPSRDADNNFQEFRRGLMIAIEGHKSGRKVSGHSSPSPWTVVHLCGQGRLMPDIRGRSSFTPLDHSSSMTGRGPNKICGVAKHTEKCPRILLRNTYRF